LAWKLIEKLCTNFKPGDMFAIEIGYIRWWLGCSSDGKKATKAYLRVIMNGEFYLSWNKVRGNSPFLSDLLWNKNE
jgi:hypothetical protein